MFTWNLQYISKTRLSDTLRQLMIDSVKGDILIRIHTGIHSTDEAVDLAAFIKGIVPSAHILGTSTSAVINEGRLHPDQCLISITKMSEAKLLSKRISFDDDGSGEIPDAIKLCRDVKKAVVKKGKGLMFVFFTSGYKDTKRFVDASNDIMPGIQMIGGVASGVTLSGSGPEEQQGFVFDEKGWSVNGMITACINGTGLDCISSVVTGVQVVGDEFEITGTDGCYITGIDGIDASVKYREGIGDRILETSELTYLFPLVYTEHRNVPFVFGCDERKLQANHNVDEGEKLRRGFVYDRRIIADNRAAFNKIETFEKAETIFGYTCRDRSRIYPNSVMWELSLYENSNISGCLTEGEIGCSDQMNIYTNCAFMLAAAGENESIQKYNPYVFSNTSSLEGDNERLIGYLMDIESDYGQGASMADNLKDFIKNCELKLLYTEKDGILNAAAMNMDIKLNGYDRVCIIDVLDISSMRMVFSEQMIEATYKSFISKCASFVSGRDYRLYIIDKWRIAIGAPSFMVPLKGFTEDMKKLQKLLFETTEQYIAIVPVFCIINDCTVDNINSVYSTARLEMINTNIQFHVCDGGSEEIDEESIRERYHMVNVINYALAHDKVIPYYQGIYDNKAKRIDHYESLMRLEDENGKVYYPGSFLDVARTYGLLYDELSRAMIRKVFERFSDCPDKSVSINLGMRDIKNEEMTDYIFSFLATVRHPENFNFEILENEDVDDYELLVKFVDTVHKLGGLISLDDFGSGYSNLQHMANIHSDYIKIDGSIVRNCCRDQESENLVALVSDWKRLSNRDIKIVAEYVENEDIQRKLEKYGIDFSQGYLFSVPAEELMDELK
jgi:EAL domain-containing protein (putative c-di-GMP-specific phosphodiesterase class I)